MTRRGGSRRISPSCRSCCVRKNIDPHQIVEVGVSVKKGGRFSVPEPGPEFGPDASMDEFQQRLLAAVEKPERNRLLAVINSAFFLWVMSALLLSIGGSYITNHKQCLDDAEKVIERRSHLSQELFFRGGALADRMAKAKTVLEATQAEITLLLRPPPAADQ